MIITLWSLDRSQLYRFLSAYHLRLSITAKECGWIDGWIDGGSQLEYYGIPIYYPNAMRPLI